MTVDGQAMMMITSIGLKSSPIKDTKVEGSNFRSIACPLIGNYGAAQILLLLPSIYEITSCIRNLFFIYILGFFWLV